MKFRPPSTVDILNGWIAVSTQNQIIYHIEKVFYEIDMSHN